MFQPVIAQYSPKIAIKAMLDSLVSPSLVPSVSFFFCTFSHTYFVSVLLFYVCRHCKEKHLSICLLVFEGSQINSNWTNGEIDIALKNVPPPFFPAPASQLSLSWLHFIPFSVLLSFNNYKSSLMALLSCLPAVFAKNNVVFIWGQM